MVCEILKSIGKDVWFLSHISCQLCSAALYRAVLLLDSY